MSDAPAAKRARAADANGVAPTRISVLGRESIVIGAGLLDSAGSIAHDACRAARYAIVTDRNVERLWLPRLVASFERAGHTPIVKVLPPGESTKCRAVQAGIEDWLLESRCGRDCCLVALGGGVVGDLTGYVAACFMRGVKVVQVPTTLLAMVDSSIGGKTGIDTPHGKNLVGAFHHPTRIIMDLEVLKTLPDRQLCNGMAEVVKTALLWDASRFAQLEAHVDDVLARDPKWLQEIVEGSAGIKAEVVTRDEKEGGLRTLLNVGHSIGHAVEAFLAPEMLHGEAVSIGTVKEAELARRLGHLSQAELGRTVRCLASYKLPTTLPRGLGVEGLMKKMAIDKKNKGGVKYISLLERIGKCVNNKAIACEDHPIEVTLARGVTVHPIGDRAIDCEVTVPGSKSVSNRALLIAALGAGECRIRGLLHSDDTQVMLNALRDMAACTYEWRDKGKELALTGGGGRMTPPPAGAEIYLGNAGTASRFLTTAVALAAPAPGRERTTLTGNKRMKERPIADLVAALRAAGVGVEFLGTDGCLPLKVKGGGLPGGDITIGAKVSSQYVSSILISSPYAAAPVALTLDGSVSQSYIDMTVSVMRDFGVKAEALGAGKYRVPRGVYQNPKEYLVEADASSATYPLAVAAVCGSGVRVTIDGIGSASIQGDAAFAHLLGRMGCEVQQQERRTTVRGPKGRLRPVDIDMEPMTDAFMTAAVVMALADGTSRITGIANQRVKECNRILAMVTELGKLGVTVRELADGLEIDGRAKAGLRPARVHCYDDHRIAMSFGVLGCSVPGITVDDKACVEKTYPEWWDHLQEHFGVRLEPADTDPDGAVEEQDASVVLVGMRGAGKTALGTHCAKAVGWRFVDADVVFEAAEGPVAAYVEKHGWPGFRKREADLLAGILSGPDGKCCVIACGGGVVESAEGREALRRSRRVVFVDKALSDIEDALAVVDGGRRPAWGEPIATVWARRRPLFRECSRYELPLPAGGRDWAAACRDAERLVRFAARRGAGAAPRSATAGGGALRAFLSLTAADVAEVVPHLAELEAGVDVLELRADRLAARGDLDAVAQQVALLRRHSALPVLFTVRTAAQGGGFAGPAADAAALLDVGRRCGCEFLDVEATLDEKARDAVVARARPQAAVVASFHDPKGAMSLTELRDAAEGASLNGCADWVKIVGTAASVDDCARFREMLSTVQLRGGARCIALLMGHAGRLSRALNEALTPVTHPLLAEKGAPGQLSVRETNRLRALAGLVPPRRFYLFGSPIAHSKSPTIHNAGFDALGLDGWSYHLCETTDAEEVRRVASQPDFGGGSVTIPLKLDVRALCTEQTEAASRIGAVNTLTPLPGGGLRGDNTDWLGIRDCAVRAGATPAGGVGVCVGAGGSARAAMWALRGLGVASLFVWNRTHEKAEQLAREFGGTAVRDLSTLDGRVDVVVSNVPGDAQGEAPAHLSPRLGPGTVVIDMAYKPRVTPLLRAAKERGAGVVEGIDVLVEQGLYQFRQWTQQNPPRKAIRAAVDERLTAEAAAG